MSGKSLRGTRYISPESRFADLPHYIAEVLPYLDLDETLAFYEQFRSLKPTADDVALLGCNDRFYLLTQICGRKDMLHPWLFARCREVEAEPDGYIDLWSREHYKSTIITFGGSLQDVICDPETTIGIFSYSRQTALKFVGQLMGEMQRNELLKTCYPDVFYLRPEVESPRWSVNLGAVVKRRSNPKEGTIEGWGLVEGQPTGVHFKQLIFDDMIEVRNVTSPEQITKATEAWELSDNLGSGENVIKRYIGTRYLIGDTYETIMDRKAAKPRIYPATHNGRIDGKPVFWSQKTWDRKRVEQKSTLAAQLLQNPAAGKQATFEAEWMRPYEIRPVSMNVYIMADPSRGRTARSDRTAMAVIGIDAQGNKYLLDGARHRMKLSQRWDMLLLLYRKWREAPGVQMIRVGYERYGQQSDDEYFEEQMRGMKDERDQFAIEELAWPNEGSNSKKDRVQRLQPDMEVGKFFLPPIIKHADLGDSYWSYNKDDMKIDYRPVQGPTRLMRAMEVQGQTYRIPKAITRRNEDGDIYDVTKALMDEMLLFPFGAHDDMPDVVSRIYDMQPTAAIQLDRIAPTTPIYPDA